MAHFESKKRSILNQGEDTTFEEDLADRFFASSKTCSACGHKLESLPLAVRGWTCPQCGAHHDRDVNAAINLRNRAVSSTVSACGEDGAGRARKSTVKPASAKQEVSFEPV